MPENKNPPEDQQPQKPEDEEERISRVHNPIPCQCSDVKCLNLALSLSDYCWEHIKNKEEYIRKLAKWVNEEKSMERFILIAVDMSGIWLLNTDLSEAWLWRAKLIGARLLGVNLCRANLNGADLSAAYLTESVLTDALLNEANLTGVRGLYRRNFSKELTIEEKKDALAFKESYMTVKNYFIQSGLYDDASWAAFRERTLERIALFNELKKKWIKGLLSWAWWKSAFKWFGSKAISLLNGYGERPLRVIISSGVIVIFFSVIHYIFKWIQSYPKELLHWWDYLYFSIVTFTTLGYGDIRPKPAPWARMVASLEAFIGAFMIALFVWTLARRYVAR